MFIRAGFDAAFEFVQPTPVLLLATIHPTQTSSIRWSERPSVVPAVDILEYTDVFGNECGRTVVPAGRIAFRSDAIVEVDGKPEMQAWDARQHSIQELPSDVLQFLLASRYCEVDSELREVAWSLFGNLPAAWPLVQAVCDLVHQHIRFNYMLARANRTALEVFHERTGVCRDYMHLAITLCRCLNVPARYCTGYLGDIGVPPQPDPMDFSAWFEVYLGHQWYALDARNNRPRIGRILMGRGRDAADVALTTTFGLNSLHSFRVWTFAVASMWPCERTLRGTPGEPPNPQEKPCNYH